jgi:hypothetical protein
MHPYIAQTLTEQRHREILRQTAESRRGPVRRFPRWHLSWSRTTLASSGQKGSSLIIIVSAHRPA